MLKFSYIAVSMGVKPYETEYFEDFEQAIVWAAEQAMEAIEEDFEEESSIAKFNFDEDWISIENDTFFFKDLAESEGEIALCSIRAELNAMIQFLYNSACSDYCFKFEKI